MTDSERRNFSQMLTALQRITQYQSVDGLRRDSQKRWGLPFEEAIGYAYENVMQEARNGLHGVRKLKVSPTPTTGVAKPDVSDEPKEKP